MIVLLAEFSPQEIPVEVIEESYLVRQSTASSNASANSTVSVNVSPGSASSNSSASSNTTVIITSPVITTIIGYLGKIERKSEMIGINFDQKDLIFRSFPILFELQFSVMHKLHK